MSTLALEPTLNELAAIVAEKLTDRLSSIVARPIQRFVTIADAAIRVGVSEDSIRRLISTGKLTALRPIKGRIVLDVNQLDAHVLSSDSRPRKGRGYSV